MVRDFRRVRYVELLDATDADAALVDAAREADVLETAAVRERSAPQRTSNRRFWLESS